MRGAPPSFVVELTEFSGPLDLLLTLIREEQVDIYDIPIARIAEQFLLRIRTLALTRRQTTSRWRRACCASRRRCCCPAATARKRGRSRAELVRRLLEYQQMREVVDVSSAPARSAGTGSRAPTCRRPGPTGGALALSLSELLAAVDRILRVTKDPAIHDVIPRASTCPARSRHPCPARAASPRRWTDLVPRGAEPWQVLSTLLGLLRWRSSANAASTAETLRQRGDHT